MTRRDALIALRDAVDAGEVVQAIDARAIWPEIGIWGEACRASQGSLDAAKALHEAVLGPVPEMIFSDARRELLRIIAALIAQEPQT